MELNFPEAIVIVQSRDGGSLKFYVGLELKKVGGDGRGGAKMDLDF